jgi:hypothetical protein
MGIQLTVSRIFVLYFALYFVFVNDKENQTFRIFENMIKQLLLLDRFPSNG